MMRTVSFRGMLTRMIVMCLLAIATTINLTIFLVIVQVRVCLTILIDISP
jgi:hypothetical protein